MAEREFLNDELRDLEAALAKLSPRASRLNRDQLMFRAGQVSVAEPVPKQNGLSRRLWPTTTAVMTAVSVVLAVMLMQSGPGGRQIVVDEPDATDLNTTQVTEEVGVAGPKQRVAPDLPIANNPISSRRLIFDGSREPNYLELRQIVLEQGLDAWPAEPVVADDGSERIDSPLATSPPATLISLLREEGLLQPREPQPSSLFDWTTFFQTGENL